MAWLLTIVGLYLFGALLFVVLTSFVNLVDRGQAPRLERHAISRVIREWLAHAYTVPLLLAGLGQPGPTESPPPRALQDQPERVPVIVVPGYGLNRGTLVFLAAFLRRQGWRWVWPVNNSPRSSPIPVYARHLGERIEELRRASGAPRVDILAHSMGGVVAAWYINRMDGAGNVRRLVTLGTPWRGTRLHVLGGRRQARDLGQDSEIVADIQQPRADVTAIWSRTDNMVSPPEHGFTDGVRTVEIEQIGHLEMVYSARAFRAARTSLAAEDPPPAEDPE